jgi:hypothetical protein
MNGWRAGVLGFVLAMLATAPLQAAPLGDLCDRLFLPEGYQLDCTVQGSAAGSGPMAVVRPVEGAFAPLSELTIRPLDEPVDDPEQWLREQLTIDLSGVEESLTGLAESPDSPFAGSSIDQHLESWLDLLGSLASLPLEGCGEPVARSGGDRWELVCEWPLGPLRQYLTLRLVERDGEQYAMRIRAMNEQRLRHLVAIANSF